MAVKTSRKRRQDATTKAIFAALRKAFPGLPTDINEAIYRYNSVSIRVLIVNPAFEGLSSAQRHLLVDRAIKDLPSEMSNDISMVIMRTPEEMERVEERGDLKYMDFVNPDRND